ncbi:hypothetical protein CERSUDRAFT_102529 [Gelatoporia subvermispora B]|uniref:3-carboxymuconate cyclase n=1 Tax=Ceriporiopsis subvermispora (strain B) TaxID=914234 RepID=M2RT91_CERS8|nr:hypothetical protein CERSUDRAFT_102529 [Gelatoporia subvermispora B]
MKLIATVSLAVLFLHPALAVKLPRRDTSTVYLHPHAATGSPRGAVYFMTNEPTGNYIIAADVHGDGRLSLNRAVATRGLGAKGVAVPVGPDALFSQGSVKVSASGEILAVVNPGSNTVSAFAINPRYPSALSMIGEPVSSEGEFPISLAVSDDGKRVCVLNGGTVNGVNCFSVDQSKGLVPIPNSLRYLGLNQTTPANGPPGSASNIIFNDAGSQLIASIKGFPPAQGFLAIWDVNQDGSLSSNFTRITPPQPSDLPFSMTIIPGKDALLITDPGTGFDIIDFSAQPQANGTAGGRSSAVAIPGQSATCWSSYSNKTGNFYLIDVGTALVNEVHVDDNLKGTVIHQYSQGQNAAPIDNDVATINGKDFLYILAANATSINVMSLNAPGQAQLVQTLDFAGTLKGAGLAINPNNVQGMSAFAES